MKIKHILPLILIAVVQIAAAQNSLTFEQLRAMADAAEPVEIERHINKTFARPGTLGRYVEVTEDLFLEGFVLTQPGARNIDLSYQSHFYHATTSPSTHGIYMESEDGKYGVRLYFRDSGTFGRMKRYHWAKVNLKGTILCREGNTYMIHDITPEGIVSVQQRLEEDLPRKVRSIAELTDEDLFTYVTIKDCEFVFKDGAYINVYEKYTCGPGPNVKGVNPNAVMDGWASPMCDKDGNQIYFMMATATEWRRSGKGVPQGNGEISGILVDTYMLRYGETHTYGLRVQTEEEIGIPWDGPSAYNLIAEWNWNDGQKIFQTNMGPVHVNDIEGRDILADVGEGFLYTDVPNAELGRTNDFNNPLVVSPDTYKTDPSTRGAFGIVERGALRISTQGKNWWNWTYNCGNSLVVNVSTEGLLGERLYLAFTFAGGWQWAENSSWFPTEWCVEYSLDGQSYTKVDIPDIKMRSLSWSYNHHNLGTIDSYGTSYEAGMGMTEHVVFLPKELLGKKHVIIRISPAKRIVASLAEMNQERGLLTPDLQGEATVHFGTIRVAYK